MTNAQPAGRRRLWLWLAAGVAVVLVVAAGIVGLGMIYGPGDDAGPQPSATVGPTSTPSTSATSAPPPPASAGVDGCLGGDSRGPQAVLDAQAAAPHTPEGAVSFAITFARWIAQKPAVPSSEVAAIDGTASLAPNLSETAASSGAVEASQFYVTSLNGYYRINAFETDRVELTLMLPLVLDGAIDPTLNLMPSYAVIWTERGWAIEDGVDVDDADTLRSTGVAITGAC